MKEGSTWDQEVTIPKFAALTQPLEVDVAIVGAGITGVTTAYLLTKLGYRVALLEKDRIGFGATGVTTAFLTQIIDTSLADLPRMFGPEKAKIILASHQEGIKIVEQIITQENIECEFQRCSNYMYANSEKELRHLRAEEKAGAKLGVPLEFKQDARLGFKNAGYLELRNQAKFHPLKYLAGLVNVLQKQGVPIFEKTEVKEILSGEKATLVTSQAEVTAKHVVAATYAPFDGKLFFKKAFYDSYVLEIEVEPGRIAEGIYEDTRDPYHYFRLDRKGKRDRLILGGEDHRSDIPVGGGKSFQALEEYWRETFPEASGKLVRRWEGPILESIDGLAWIGRHKEPNIYYATGFSGNGMTYSMIAAQLLSDLIQGKPNAWESLYNPRRWPTLWQLAYKGRDYTREMIGGAVRNTFRRRG